MVREKLSRSQLFIRELFEWTFLALFLEYVSVVYRMSPKIQPQRYRLRHAICSVNLKISFSDCF